MDADITLGNLGVLSSLKTDLIGAVSFDATYVYFHKASCWCSVCRRQATLECRSLVVYECDEAIWYLQ